MPSSLGLYIEDNIIKYAKITKNQEAIKAESVGVKFYDNLHEAVKKIIEETYSFKIPIAINVSNEMYKYFYMSNLLNSKDLMKALDKEFQAYCYERNMNIGAFEFRSTLVNNIEEKNKIKSMYMYVNKAELERRLHGFEELRVTGVFPTSIAATTLLEKGANKNENVAIVNIEDITTVTVLLDGNLYSVETFEQGMKNIIDKITTKEKSVQKSYEICKNTTIYTSGAMDLGIEDDENEHLEDIMPVLYEIVSNMMKITNAHG